MKTLYKLLILIVLCPIVGFSFNNNALIVRQKNIKKAFLVNADAGINIENSYGNITVATWDENKIELDIVIKVSGSSEKWVNKRVEDIDVKIDAFTHLLSAKTIIETDFFNIKENTNSFEINYIIKIPKNGSVKLINKYGNIITGDILGNVDVNCKYGKINLGKLNGVNTKIELGYCPKSTVESVKNASIDLRYSGLTIQKAMNLKLDSNYTDVVVGDCQNLNYDSNYGKLIFDNVNNIQGSGNYMTLNVIDLKNNVQIETNYSKINIGRINENANNISIDAGYSDITIGYDNNYAFDFDLSSKYADIRLANDLEFSNKEITNNSKQYSGFYKKKGVNKLKIVAKYGNINLIKKQ